jgi:cytochrome c553
VLSHNRLLLALGAFGLSMALSSAQTLVGNPEEAKKIVETQCAACHGVFGEGVAALPNQAKLGGQGANYLSVQLHALKESKDASGSRFEMTMSPQAGLLSDQDIANVAAYFSQQPTTYYKLDADFEAKRQAAAAGIETAKAELVAAEAKEAEIKEQLKADPENAALQKESKAVPRAVRAAKGNVRKAEDAVKQVDVDLESAKTLMVRGEQIYFGGDLNKRIPACAACHSPSGSGNGPAAYPAVAGQNYEYLVNQLENFKNAKRTNDPAGMMRDIAERMSDTEIDAVATYIKYMGSK